LIDESVFEQAKDEIAQVLAIEMTQKTTPNLMSSMPLHHQDFPPSAF
jgi:hypothetical protein